MNPHMDFDYLHARTIGDAISMLEKYGDDARLFAGGTELLLNIKHHAMRPKVLIDIKSIPDLAYIRFEQDTLRIGPLTPLRNLEDSPQVRDRYPLLLDAVRSIATVQIRNVGTVGGNICQTVKCPYYNQSHINLFMRQSIDPCRQRGGKVCHAASVDSLHHSILGRPVNGCVAATASDLATPLMALKASVRVVGPGGERIIPIKDFLLGGGRTALQKNEVLVEIEIPAVPDMTKTRYEKYAHSTRNFHILNAAILIRPNSGKKICEQACVVLGGIRPVPFHLKSVESGLKNARRIPTDLREPFHKDTQGARVQGDLSAFKLKRAETMIMDMVQSLFNELNVTP